MPEKNPKTQEELFAAVAEKKQYTFFREQNRYAVIVTAKNQKEVQSLLNSNIINIGEFDGAEYNGEYFDNGVIRIGISIMINDETDLYPNPDFKYIKKVENDGKFDNMSFSHLIGVYAVKETRKMVKMADAFDEDIVIAASWGIQPVAIDGWLNIDKKIHGINAGDDGLPMGFKK